MGTKRITRSPFQSKLRLGSSFICELDMIFYEDRVKTEFVTGNLLERFWLPVGLVAFGSVVAFFASAVIMGGI